MFYSNLAFTIFSTIWFALNNFVVESGTTQNIIVIRCYVKLTLSYEEKNFIPEERGFQERASLSFKVNRRKVNGIQKGAWRLYISAKSMLLKMNFTVQKSVTQNRPKTEQDTLSVHAMNSQCVQKVD